MKFLYLSLVILSLIGRLLFTIGTIYIGYRIFLWAGGGFAAFFVGIFAAGFFSPILYLPLIGIDMLQSYIAHRPSSGARENRDQRRAVVTNRPLPVHSVVREEELSGQEKQNVEYWWRTVCYQFETEQYPESKDDWLAIEQTAWKYPEAVGPLVDWYLEEQALEGRELQREAVLELAQADPTFLVEWLKREAAEA